MLTDDVSLLSHCGDGDGEGGTNKHKPREYKFLRAIKCRHIFITSLSQFFATSLKDYYLQYIASTGHAGTGSGGEALALVVSFPHNEATEICHYKITECIRLEGTTVCGLVQPPFLLKQGHPST